ncbi:arginyl-tRNA synthetase [Rhizobiales bacterium GAS113]|nr:arginyl-tRNA synthetase [Rhizobiales bacterium GAS113]SEE77415.1 arginyl-tRNA synthetase [Rhizobiales bacterium GAS188]
MNIFKEFERRIAAALAAMAADAALPAGLDLSRVVCEPPRDAKHGDISTNAAMVLAKEAKTNPRALAEAIAPRLVSQGVVKAEVAGPGFINLTLDRGVFDEVLRACLAQGAQFGASDLGQDAKVNVEFVSANPTGPMHVGHGRGAVVGDAIASVLAFTGHDVAREYYINDAGVQVDVLARSAHLRYREALGESIGEIPAGLYPGDYLKPVGESLARRHGAKFAKAPEAEWLPVIRAEVIQAMMALIREDLATLGIRHDVFFSERSLIDDNSDIVAAVIADLEARGLVYQGRLPPPKGQVDEDWEDREQTLFRSTQFGDDVDRPLKKSDGSFTYFAADIAYHASKFQRGFNHMIDVLGADHGGYVKRMQAAVRAVSAGAANLDVRLCQLVRLLREGEPVKMSKRSGDFVTLREVVDEVGADPVRFMMLMRKNDAPLDFDLVKVIEQSKDNPVFYVQYAHARCESVRRQAAEALPTLDQGDEALAAAELQLLADASERALINLIAQYPRVVQQAAQAHEPHRVTFYLYDLASEFHAHWNKGKDFPDLRFINANSRNLTSARLALVTGLRNVLASGLALIGVSAPREMR